MTTERLTKSELTWLLTQEARSASQKLRQGVSLYSTEPTVSAPPIEGTPPSIPPPSSPGSTLGSLLPSMGSFPSNAAPTISAMPSAGGLPGLPSGLSPSILGLNRGTSIQGAGVEVTLNHLDEAVGMLANLYGHTASRGRRGKIDIAALLWEVAPEARVQIEMGEGTTVFGDEAELKRMLHVLLGHTGNSAGTPVEIRRVGEEISVGVTLGPDTSATYQAERAWLSRMAMRYGGRLALDGSTQTLILAADVDPQRRELESAKKELAAAQAQAEAYARDLAELATMLVSPEPTPSQVPPAPSHVPPSADGLAVLVAAVRSLGAELRGILSSIGRDIAPLRDREGDVGELAASVGRHVTGASQLVGALSRLGSCPIGELPRQADVADLLREAMTGARSSSERGEVTVDVVAPASADALVPMATLATLFHVLVDHAIQASPIGGKVTATLTEGHTADGHDALIVTFDDSGTPLPPSAQNAVLSRDFEAIAHGRPRALSLVAAQALAAHLHAPLEIDAAPTGGARVRLVLIRP